MVLVVEVEIEMIPKVIHYCWFGKNKLPESALKCIDSWKKYCPDYKIKEWNEDNFDINSSCYVREAYEAKKWAFVTDYVRLYALYKEGGIYMDTDVEVIKPLDDFLDLKAFTGFETKTSVPTGIMASEQGLSIFKELLDDYEDRHFIDENGHINLTTNVVMITQALKRYGLKLNNQLQTIQDITLFPKAFFCPKSYETGKILISTNTYTIHHFAGSWLSPLQIKMKKINAFCIKKCGTVLGQKIGLILVFPIKIINSIQLRGFFNSFRYIFKIKKGH